MYTNNIVGIPKVSSGLSSPLNLTPLTLGLGRQGQMEMQVMQAHVEELTKQVGQRESALQQAAEKLNKQGITHHEYHLR